MKAFAHTRLRFKPEMVTRETNFFFSFNSLWLKPIRWTGFVQAFQIWHNELNVCDSHFRVKQIRWFAHDFSGNLLY